MSETPDVDLQDFNPMDPAIQQNPFPMYAALRRDTPVFRHPQTGLYFVSRLDTVNKVLADTDTFSSRFSNAAASSTVSPETRAELARILADTTPPSNTMLTADPPEQTRYRKAVGRDFNQRVPTFEPSIRAIAAELLDGWPRSGRVDFVNSFGVPFPVRSIARALAMKSGLEADIKRWSDDSVAGLGVAIDDARRLEAARGIVELQSYWAQELQQRRDQPTDDFVSDLAHARFEETDGTRRPLEIGEMVSILQQFMVAGNETTTKLLNELILLFAQNPDEWRRVREDPARIPAAVEEGLRLGSPNQGLFRQVRREVELEGVTIPEGSTAWVMFGSANRDERTFPDPDRFDPSRQNLREHVAFGHGAHFCIGAPLARLETRIAIEEIALRVETIRLAEGATLRYEPSFILRGLAELELEIDWA